MGRIEQLQEFIAASGKDSFLQHALALEYIKVGDDQQAALLFTELLTADPGYVGSYYQLGKLQERLGQQAAAIATYTKGMEKAGIAGDKHAYNELRGALEELED